MSHSKKMSCLLRGKLLLSYILAWNVNQNCESGYFPLGVLAEVCSAKWVALLRTLLMLRFRKLTLKPTTLFRYQIQVSVKRAYLI